MEVTGTEMGVCGDKVEHDVLVSGFSVARGRGLGNFSETGCNEELSLSALSTIWSKLDRVVNNVNDNHANTRYWRGDGG